MELKKMDYLNEAMHTVNEARSSLAQTQLCLYHGGASKETMETMGDALAMANAVYTRVKREIEKGEKTMSEDVKKNLVAILEEARDDILELLYQLTGEDDVEQEQEDETEEVKEIRKVLAWQNNVLMETVRM